MPPEPAAPPLLRPGVRWLLAAGVVAWGLATLLCTTGPDSLRALASDASFGWIPRSTPLPRRGEPLARFWLAEVERVLARHPETPELLLGAAWCLNRWNLFTQLNRGVSPGSWVTVEDRETFDRLCLPRSLELGERAVRLAPGDVTVARDFGALLLRVADSETPASAATEDLEPMLDQLERLSALDRDNALYDNLAATLLWNQSAQRRPGNQASDDAHIVVLDEDRYSRGRRLAEAALEKPCLSIGAVSDRNYARFLRHTILSPADQADQLAGRLFLSRMGSWLLDCQHWSHASMRSHFDRGDTEGALQELSRVRRQLQQVAAGVETCQQWEETQSFTSIAQQQVLQVVAEAPAPADGSGTALTSDDESRLTEWRVEVLQENLRRSLVRNPLDELRSASFERGPESWLLWLACLALCALALGGWIRSSPRRESLRVEWQIASGWRLAGGMVVLSGILVLLLVLLSWLRADPQGRLQLLWWVWRWRWIVVSACFLWALRRLARHRTRLSGASGESPRRLRGGGLVLAGTIAVVGFFQSGAEERFSPLVHRLNASLTAGAGSFDLGRSLSASVAPGMVLGALLTAGMTCLIQVVHESRRVPGRTVRETLGNSLRPLSGVPLELRPGKVASDFVMVEATLVALAVAISVTLWLATADALRREAWYRNVMATADDAPAQFNRLQDDLARVSADAGLQRQLRRSARERLELPPD